MVDNTNKERPPITRREYQILQQMAEGIPNEAIAEKMFIAFNTVRTHRRNIRVKLGIKETSLRRVVLYQEAVERLSPFFKRELLD